MPNPTTFSGVHDYLDIIFKGRDASEDEIISAKKWYWKCYNTTLKRRSRKKHQEFSVWFTKQELDTINNLNKKNEPISAFLRKVIIAQFQSENSLALTIDTAVIEQQLFLIAEYLQELLENETGITAAKIQTLTLQIKELVYLTKQDFDH